MGEAFDISKPVIVDATAFELRNSYRNVTEYMEELELYNQGNESAYQLPRHSHPCRVLVSMNEQLAIDLYRHGQAVGTGVLDNRIKSMNGASEAINNGIDNSWDGNFFPVYGTKTRASYGTALNGNVYFAGIRPERLALSPTRSSRSRLRRRRYAAGCLL